MIYIYILYSAGSDKFYVGQTTDFQTRLFQHNNSNRSTYTSKHRPWTPFALFQVLGTAGDATKIERFIKAQKNKSFILRISNPETELKGNLAKLLRISIPKFRDRN
ncbi:MAG: GIY-YIG nuclease family protein [Chitinophagales bacterium]|nr:GIY-YIG nuclease family protein [Chitinophagales bacterium]